jgi:hypothetical protein
LQVVAISTPFKYPNRWLANPRGAMRLRLFRAVTDTSKYVDLNKKEQKKGPTKNCQTFLNQFLGLLKAF